MTQRDPELDALARDIATRAAAAVGLAGIALIHRLDSIDTYADTRYLFWMYVALMLACVVLAALVPTARPAPTTTSATGRSRSGSPRCSSRAA